VCLIKHHAKQAYGIVDMKLKASLTLAQVVGKSHGHDDPCTDLNRP